MIRSHILGFPRIGTQRELKRAVEDYWRGAIDAHKLRVEGKRIYTGNWELQAKSGLSLITVGDFSWYDQILDMSTMLGVIPERFGAVDGEVSLDTYFRMARGRAPHGHDAKACDMTKWFDTNYHYIVPEFRDNQQFHFNSTHLFEMIAEAQKAGYQVKPVIPGPLSYLWLGKAQNKNVKKLELLPRLLPVYREIIQRFHELHIDWVQMDEPILVLDLPEAWQQGFETAYQYLADSPARILLTTYFGGLGDNAKLACKLPVSGLHIDICRAPEQLTGIPDLLSANKILSLGIVDGRNIWRNDLRQSLQLLQPICERFEEVWIASSCSLLHSPVDLGMETQLDPELKKWLAFAVQKTEEVVILARGLAQGESSIADALAASDDSMATKKVSTKIHKAAVAQRLKGITPASTQRQSGRTERKKIQQKHLNLPLYPTTTIGSFPQTSDIRILRQQAKAGSITAEDYHSKLQQHIRDCIQKQEDIGIDVLVHGEFERNDMVEYFSDFLDGFAMFTTARVVFCIGFT